MIKDAAASLQRFIFIALLTDSSAKSNLKESHNTFFAFLLFLSVVLPVVFWETQTDNKFLPNY